ncbi:MAG TPA: hypothetical protein VMU56_05175 [Beijerinckiaceae bacterium]|nr:hypothetical protein [Beijerinckiaceae bacterium]
MKALILLSFAALFASSSPILADAQIRQYYQQPVPAPYPGANTGRAHYRPPPPQTQQTWPQQVRPAGSPRIRMESN